MASVTREQLAALEEYGVIAKRRSSTELYGEDAVEIAAAAGGFLRAGVDARHLRAWRTSVEREVGLYEQLVMPLLRQRNPQARAEATRQLDELNALGAKLRNALLRAAVHQQFAALTASARSDGRGGGRRGTLAVWCRSSSSASGSRSRPTRP